MHGLPATTGGALTSPGPHRTFSAAWLECLDTVLSHGSVVADGETEIRELLNVSVAARSCHPDNLVSAGASAERIDLMVRKYSDLAPVPPYTISYGSLFRDHQGVDQVSRVVAKLRAKRETKQATMAFQTPSDPHLPCISLLDFKIRDGALHANAVYRSQNVYASQPGNAVAVRRIQEEIGQLLDTPIGLLTFHVLSAHIYVDDVETVRSLLEGQRMTTSADSEGA